MYTLPADENERLAALHALRVLDTAAEERFDRITRMAQTVFNVPMALISLVDADRQWFKSCQGVSLRETVRDSSFCTHAILQDEVFVVEDARQAPLFADNPLVTGTPWIRFYAGYPLQTRSGRKIGTLCLLDREPRSFNESQRRQLRDLAAWAESELHLLEVQNAEREALIARLGHELRTPLTAVLGALGLLQEDSAGSLPDPVAGYVQMAVQNSRRLAETIDHLLAAERLLTGRQPPQYEAIEVGPFIQGQVDAWQAKARAHHCRVQQGPVAAGSLYSDRATLTAALAHLLDNACKFSPPGGEVTLQARPERGGWLLEVLDEGPGLSADVLPQLFQPFAQSQELQFGAHGGCGLGLYVCRSLLETVGAQVSGQSRQPRGARFALFVPGR